MHIAEATRSVNGVSRNNSQGGIGHNGGPEIYVREVGKLQAIDAVLRDPRYSQTQALILIGLIVRSDNNFDNAFPGATTLALYAKVSKRHTVFDALNKLEGEHKVIRREQRGSGRTNVYAVLPQAVISAVVEAYEKTKGSAADRHITSAADRHITSAADRHGSDEKVVPLTGTAQQTARADESTTSAADRHSGSAADRHTIHSLSNPISIPHNAREKFDEPPTENLADPYSVERVTIDDGRVQIHNGLRAEWVRLFGGDEIVLDAALMGVSVQKNGTAPEVQVSRQLTVALQRQRSKPSFVSDRDARMAKADDAYKALEFVKKKENGQ